MPEMALHDDAPTNVQRFVADCIDSVEQLRVLLLLFSDRQRPWTVAEITRELRSVESSIEKRLNDLYGRKVLLRESDPAKHRFVPFSPEIEATIAELAKLHEVRPYRVIEMIYSRPSEALRQFADAFKIKKDKKL
jgi:hypothetical protein